MASGGDDPHVGGLRAGAMAEHVHRVSTADTASEVGSGDVPVLATPRLLAWFEAATVAALDGALADADTSVGTRVEIDHMAPSRVGAEVTVRAEVFAVDGRLIRYRVAASHQDGTVVAQGQVARIVVDRARFLGRVGPPHRQ